MPKSACIRCGQNIEYDASYEGQEVVCPSCENITRLQSKEPDRRIPVAGPIPAPGDPTPRRPAVPQPPAFTAKGPTTLPPGVKAPPAEEVLPAPDAASVEAAEAKAVTVSDRIPPSDENDDDDDALPARFAPGPRRKVAPARRKTRPTAAPPPPPGEALES